MLPERTSQRLDWTDRFEVRRKLAAGNFGVVYLAHDRQRGTDVALKALREPTGAVLYRFKREFRGLADIVHPNLVTLYELHHAGEQWFFTMEYVPGESFLDWVRPVRAGAVEAEMDRERARQDSDVTATVPIPSERLARAERPELLVERLRESLYQLVDGVHALHVTNRLHRDLKPSNVRVTPEGRVVLLDFGLTSDVRQLSVEHTHESAAIGTPSYMSPEQAEDRPLGPASDWYSVGVMLFEALTGRRPFEGGIAAVLDRKKTLDAPAPSEVAADVPPDLDALCRQLLARDPAQRPEGMAIFAALGRAPSAQTLELAGVTAPRFVGRQVELDALTRAYARTREGRPVAVLVRGSSGMGKSVLVRHFLDEVALPMGAVVLEGRCYERESVPYKGLDHVIDAFATYLVQQPQDRLEQLLPRDIQALARLFPVLRRVPAIAEPNQLWLAPPDPHELRRRAFNALCSMLRRLAEQVPVVMYIDDVQWGDADAAAFLADLVLHPEPPAMLLVACCRLEEEDASLLVQALRQRAAGARAEVRELVVGGLSAGEANELVATVTTVAAPKDARADVESLLRESGGNPLFLSELARARGGHAAASLDELLADRAGRLPDEARLLFEVCAVAGRPVPTEVALAAAGLPGEGEALALLQRERLLRVRNRDERRLVEPYHDRVRESAVARMSAERRGALHRRLAESFEAAMHRDAESLTTHWRGAAERDRAARWARVAAQAAMDTYAFNRAATLYHQALESSELAEAERHEIKVRLAHSLENCGRLDEAAAAFGEAAAETSGPEQIDLRRLQVEQVLRRGLLAEGRPLAGEVLRAVGFGMPSSHRGALVSMIANRTMLRLHGFGFEERPAAAVPAAALQGLDVLYSISAGLAFLDPILGRALQARYMRRAVQVGEPERMVKALCLEMGYRSLAGEPSWALCEELRARGLAISDRLDAPHLPGHIQTISGIAAFMCGRFELGLDRVVEGAHVLRDFTVGHRFHIDIAEIIRISCLLYLGRVREANRVLAILVREAEESGDAYALRGLRSWRGNVAWVLQDRPDLARQHLDANAPRGREPFNLTSYYELCSRTGLDLYTGAVDAAAARMNEDWPAVERSFLLRLQTVRIEGQHWRGRVALAVAARDAGVRRRQCALARALADRIDRERTGWSSACAELLRAGAARATGELAAAERHLRTALDASVSAHMALYANVARRCLGLLIGGDEGRAMVADAEAWMLAEEITRPDAVCATLAPGCAPA